MSLQEEGPKRPLTVVIPASSGGVSARTPIAFLRPIMGRPQLSCLLDAVLTLTPDDIVVFVHGADDKTQSDIRTLMPPGGTVVAGSDDPVALAGTMLEYLRGRPGDVLLIPATAAPLDGGLLAGLAQAYRQQPETPCRITANGKQSGVRPGPIMADASLVGGIDVFPDDGNKPFVDLVYTLVDRAASDGVREYPVPPGRLPGDVALPRDYAAAVRIVREAVVGRLMDAGVTVIDPERTYVDWGVTADPGTTLYPDTYLEGRTSVGRDCVIGPSAKIADSTLGDAVIVKMCSVITESVVEAGVQIGPFAHIRPKTRLGKDVKIGNFVEVKKSTIGQGSKASHLSYLGDAEIGKDVNVGAGTITCNYDGAKKHTTTIGDGVFIGSDTQFVAPVVVGDDSLIGAGSTITKDVPPNSLAVARSKQVTIPGRGVKSRKEPT